MTGPVGRHKKKNIPYILVCCFLLSTWININWNGNKQTKNTDFFYSPNRQKKRDMDKKRRKSIVPDRKVPKQTNKDRNTQKQKGKLTKRT